MLEFLSDWGVERSKMQQVMPSLRIAYLSRSPELESCLIDNSRCRGGVWEEGGKNRS